MEDAGFWWFLLLCSRQDFMASHGRPCDTNLKGWYGSLFCTQGCFSTGLDTYFFLNRLTLFDFCDLNCFWSLIFFFSVHLGLFSPPYLFIPFADVSYFSYSWPPRALFSFFISHLLQVKASHTHLQSFFLFFCLKNDKLLRCQLSRLNARRLSRRPDSLLLSKCKSKWPVLIRSSTVQEASPPQLPGGERAQMLCIAQTAGLLLHKPFSLG